MIVEIKNLWEKSDDFSYQFTIKWETELQYQET
jgi:hypothetical protein